MTKPKRQPETGAYDWEDCLAWMHEKYGIDPTDISRKQCHYEEWAQATGGQLGGFEEWSMLVNNDAIADRPIWNLEWWLADTKQSRRGEAFPVRLERATEPWQIFIINLFHTAFGPAAIYLQH